MSDFKLTIWQTGETFTAQIECPAYVARKVALAVLTAAMGWATNRVLDTA